MTNILVFLIRLFYIVFVFSIFFWVKTVDSSMFPHSFQRNNVLFAHTLTARESISVVIEWFSSCLISHVFVTFIKNKQYSTVQLNLLSRRLRVK